jgi:signal transduction histidine kinase
MTGKPINQIYLPTRIKIGLITMALLLVVNQAAQSQQINPAPVFKKPEDSVMYLIKGADRIQNVQPDSGAIASVAYADGRKHRFISSVAWWLDLMANNYCSNGSFDSGTYRFCGPVSFDAQSLRCRKHFVAAASATIENYFPLGMYDSAAISCYRIIDLYQNNANSLEIASVRPLIDAYQYLAVCWLRMGFTSRAHKYILIAENLTGIHDEYYLLSSVLLKKAGIFLEEHRPDSALATLQQCLTYLEPDDTSKCAEVLVNTALAYAQQGHTSLAIQSLNKVMFANTGPAIDSGLKITATQILGDVYYRSGNYQKARAVLEPLLREASNRKLNFHSLAAVRTLAQTYFALGQPTLAYSLLDSLIERSEYLRNKDKFQMLNMMDEHLLTAEKDKRIIRHELQLARQKAKLREKNTWIGVSFAGIATLGLFAGMLFRSRKQERRLQLHTIQTLKSEREVLRLRAMFQGEESERERFARELHDGFIAQLSAIKMNLSLVQPKVAYEAQHRDALSLLDETIHELSQTAYNLIPVVLLRKGLAAAIEAFCVRAAQIHNLMINCHISGEIPLLQYDFQLAIYRMVQEAIHNVVKHAHASQVLVQIDCNDYLLGVTIEDNGSGIQVVENEQNGLGIDSLRKRSASFNGSLSIGPAANGGTVVYFEFEILRYLLRT